MSFKMNNYRGYSREMADKALNGEQLYLVGLQLETQREYVNDEPTNNITGYQLWVATPSHNPFKVKFSVEEQPNLDGFSIGDPISFDNLEAIQIRNNVYFRASKIKKG